MNRPDLTLPSEYAAPVAEALTETQPLAEVFAVAGRLSDTLRASASQADQHRQLLFSACDALRASGLLRLRIPSQFGGIGGSWETVIHVFIALAKGDPNLAQVFLVHLVGVERIALMGTDAQRRRLLTLAAGGSLFGGAEAERGGGTFRGEVHTQVARVGNRTVMNGTKHYCTGALYADYLTVRALDPDGALASVFVRADQAGIERHDDWDGVGQRLTGSGTSCFADVEVAPENIMPLAPWTARRHHGGAASQLLHAAIEVGVSLAALEDATEWAREKVRPVKESGVKQGYLDPYLLLEAGRLSTLAQTARALLLRAARSIDVAAERIFTDPITATEVDSARSSKRTDKDESPYAAYEALSATASILTAEAKIVATEAALEVTQAIFNLGGASMTLRAHNFDRHWRNVRTHTLHDPVAYKCRAVGNHLVNGTLPPMTFSY